MPQERNKAAEPGRGAPAQALVTALEQTPGTQIGINLDAQHVSGPDGALHGFEIDPFRKECLLAGADEVAFTLSLGNQIDAFEKTYECKVSWN